MPPLAASNSPSLDRRASVKAPASKPKSSASSSVSGIAAAFCAMNGLPARGPLSWRIRASSPLPVAGLAADQDGRRRARAVEARQAARLLAERPDRGRFADQPIDHGQARVRAHQPCPSRRAKSQKWCTSTGSTIPRSAPSLQRRRRVPRAHAYCPDGQGVINGNPFFRTNGGTDDSEELGVQPSARLGHPHRAEYRRGDPDPARLRSGRGRHRSLHDVRDHRHSGGPPRSATSTRATPGSIARRTSRCTSGSPPRTGNGSSRTITS